LLRFLWVCVNFFDKNRRNVKFSRQILYFYRTLLHFNTDLTALAFFFITKTTILMKFYTKFFMFCAALISFTAAQAQFTHPLLFEVNTPLSIASSYPYGPQSGAGWGITALLNGPVTGDVVWAYDNTPDSLVCDTVLNDYTGKIVLIRRGTCNFSQKMYNAQLAGAVGCVICNNQGGSAIINMAAGTFGAQVTIPSVSISEQNCALLAAELAAGNTVNATFRKPFISGAVGYYAYETPKAQIQPLDSVMNVDLTNASSTTATTITAMLKITEPSGNVINFSESLASLASDSTQTMVFNSSYSPVDTGMYNMVFKSSLSGDSIMTSFKISESVFALDRQENYSWSALSAADYTNGFRFDWGNTYVAGPSGGVAKNATFAFGDNAFKFLGKVFNLRLYELPAGVPGGTADYTTFTLAAVGVCTLGVADTAAYTLITKPLIDVNILLDSTNLVPNTQYMLVINYERAATDTLSECPRFAFSGEDLLLSTGTTVWGGGRLYMGGFGADGPKAVLRLNTNDRLVSTSVVSINQPAQFNLFPNPAKDVLNIDLNLEETAQNATITMFDVNGRILHQLNYSNIKQQTLQLNTSELTSGFYFVRIQTEKGVQVKEFSKK